MSANNFLPNPNPATPVPTVSANQPFQSGANASKRAKFGSFLENTITPPAPPGGGISSTAQTAPVAQLPPMKGGMNLPPQAGGMMGAPRPPIGAPRPPMGGAPQGGPMGAGLGAQMNRPMMMGNRPSAPQQPVVRKAMGGIVQGYSTGGGVMEQAKDASGNIVPGLFRMKYDDGTFSQAADVRTVDKLRRASLAGEAPTNTISEAEYLEKLEPMVMTNTENLSVVDVGGQNPNERLGNDMVMMTFADGTKRQTQKALYEAANELGVLDDMSSGDDFADWHLNEWAGKVVSDPTYKAAHDTFNTNQIGYNQTLMDNDPTIAASRLSFVQANAGDNQAAIDAAQGVYDQYYGGDDVVSDSDTVVDGTPGGGSTVIDSGLGDGGVTGLDGPVTTFRGDTSGDGDGSGGVRSVVRYGTPEGRSLFGPRYTNILDLGYSGIQGLAAGGIVYDSQGKATSVSSGGRGPDAYIGDPYMGQVGVVNPSAGGSVPVGPAIVNPSKGYPVSYGPAIINPGAGSGVALTSKKASEEPEFSIINPSSATAVPLNLPEPEPEFVIVQPSAGTSMLPTVDPEAPQIEDPMPEMSAIDEMPSVSDVVVEREEGDTGTNIAPIARTSYRFKDPQNVENDRISRGLGLSFNQYGGSGVQGVGRTNESRALFGDIDSPDNLLSGRVRGMQDGGDVPRETTIAGQPHYLAYINPQEGALLKGLGGSGDPGPGGIPSYNWDWSDPGSWSLSNAMDSISNAFSGGNTQSNDDFFASVNKGSNWDDEGKNTGGISDDSDKDYVTVSSDETSVATGSNDSATNYDSSSEVTPFTNSTAGSTLIDFSKADPNFSLNLSEEQQKSIDDALADYWNTGGGSLVTGGASDSNQDFFDSVNQGSNFNDDNNSGSVNTSAKDADLAVGGGDNKVTADQLNTGEGTKTLDTDGGGSLTVSDETAEDIFGLDFGADASTVPGEEVSTFLEPVDTSDTPTYTPPAPAPEPVYTPPPPPTYYYDRFGNRYTSASARNQKEQEYDIAEAAAQQNIQEAVSAGGAGAKFGSGSAVAGGDDGSTQMPSKEDKFINAFVDMNKSTKNYDSDEAAAEAGRQFYLDEASKAAATIAGVKAKGMDKVSPLDDNERSLYLDLGLTPDQIELIEYGLEDYDMDEDPLNLQGSLIDGDDDEEVGEDYTPTAAELLEQLKAAGETDLRSDQSDVDFRTTSTTDALVDQVVDQQKASGVPIQYEGQIYDVTDPDQEAAFREAVASDPATISAYANKDLVNQSIADKGASNALTSGDYDSTILPTSGSRAELFRQQEENLSSASGLGTAAPSAGEEETKEALMNAVKKRVSEVEGTTTDDYDTGGYSRLLGNTETQFTDKPLTEMTVGEVLQLQLARGEGTYAAYSQTVNAKNGNFREDGTPKISTPAGKYQIVGDTLQRLVDNPEVGVSLDDKFDAATQEKLGSYLIENRGLFDTDNISDEQFQENLGKEFQGIEVKGYDSAEGQTTVTTPSGENVEIDTNKPENKGLGNNTAVDQKMNADQYAPLIEQIQNAAKEGFLEGLGYDIAGNMFYGLGRDFVEDLRGKNQADREKIAQDHVAAIVAGAVPMVDDKGNYIGYRNIQGESDLVVDQKWEMLLPPTDEDDMRRKADLDGDGVPDYQEFANRISKQEIAADNDPYGMSTATGFLVDETFTADMDGDGEDETYEAGTEYTVNTDGTVVEAGSEDDTTGGLSLLGEDLVALDLAEEPKDGEEVGGGGLTDLVVDPEDEVVIKEPEQPEPETPEPEEEEIIEKNYTMVDGEIVCNDEGYVYNTETDTCEPPVEEEEEEEEKERLPISRTFRSTRPSVVREAPTIAPVNIPSTSPEAKSLGFANGGSVGLNKVADNFLRALGG